MKRWVLDLSNVLIDEGFSRKEAFKKAHAARNLLELLGRGKVTFEYTKKDGTIRAAHGTLCKGVSREYDSYVRKGNNDHDCKSGVFSYWDSDVRGFRSFDIRNPFKIILTTIKKDEE